MALVQCHRHVHQKVEARLVLSSLGKSAENCPRAGACGRLGPVRPTAALLPFGGHKGYGLGIVAEFFAGALTGNGCTDPNNAERLLNGMFTIIVDPSQLPKDLGFDEEARRFIDYVKSSRRTPGVDEILLPGEIEDRTREDRLKNGIPLDDSTWSTIRKACREAGVRHEWVR